MYQERKTTSIVEMVDEHNILNGFRFVLLEFMIVVCAALFIGYVGLKKGQWGFEAAGLGIAVNAAAICLTVIRQIRRGEHDLGLHETYFGKRRAEIHREHPARDRHTMQLCLVFLVPFLLAAMILRGRREISR